jgi:hypothetical protein
VTGTTSSIPDGDATLEVEAGGARLWPGVCPELAGRGDLTVISRGHAPGAALELWVGDDLLELRADARGEARWSAPGLLGQLAGEVRVGLGEQEVRFQVRPDKLVSEAICAMVSDLESVGEGLAQAVGARSTFAGLRSREGALSVLERAVGLAASAAPALRRRPLHRPQEVVRAIPRETGPRTAADVRWLATHPVQTLRASASGRAVAVSRERRMDLDVPENRGALAAYDRLQSAVVGMRGLVSDELQRLEAGREVREAFLTERGNLWLERDLPQVAALGQRQQRLEGLRQELGSVRRRAGLPELRPRGSRMLRTARVEAEPAYWTTYRAQELVLEVERGQLPPQPAPVRTLDALWEQWSVVAVVRALTTLLGSPSSGRLVDPGWFSTLRQGVVASWSTPERQVQVLYEPVYAYRGEEDVQKLHPGRPWRPDVVVEVCWADGTFDLHVLDAKFRWEAGSAPWSALIEVWWKYGESLGDKDGLPLTRSCWVLWPGDGVRLVGPRMLHPRWPIERLRGGTLGLQPGEEGQRLVQVLRTVLASGAAPTLVGGS